jgi:hypothetical protein
MLDIRQTMPTLNMALPAQIMSNLTAISSVGILFWVLIANANTATAYAVPDMSEKIHEMLLPKPNATGGPAGEIECYALPYGAIGIISNLLTFWTMAWMAVGRIPLWPWYRMNSSKFDMVLAVVTLCTCIPIASITIHRCRLSWHFILIGVWKLVTSVSLACVTLHRCFIARREDKDRARNAPMSRTPHLQMAQSTQYSPLGSPNPTPNPQAMYKQGNNSTALTFFTDTSHPPLRKDYTPLYWLVLYLAGTVCGMTGLLALVYTSFRHNRLIRNLSYGFAAPAIVLPLLTAVFFYKKHLELPNGGYEVLISTYKQTTGGALISLIAVFGVFSALYSDLVLGAIADNLFGLPSGDFAPLYWAWFVAKRVSLLSH